MEIPQDLISTVIYYKGVTDKKKFKIRVLCFVVFIYNFKLYCFFRGLGLLGHLIIQLIIHDVLKFALFYLVILFAFSGGLFLSFKGDGDLDVHNETR